MGAWQKIMKPQKPGNSEGSGPEVIVVVVGYPTPSEGWGHDGRPWSPRSRATPQGLDQRSYKDRESPKSERRKESVAGQCRMR